MNIFIQAVGSDIGYELAKHYINLGDVVIGTYRTKNKKMDELTSLGAKLIHCDIALKTDIFTANAFMSAVGRWDVLIMCTGSQGPIGNFISINFENWRESFEVNFIAQMQFIHVALHARNLNKSTPPIVIMFAGGGTNSAPKNYSAYTVSKIASIKMCELLSVEVVDTTFSIIGPGWVKTKIHDATLLAGTNAGESYEKTKDMLESNNCIPIERVVACCDWLINADPGLVNGRNFSVAYDPWDKEDITSISKDNNNFKLRRFGSDIFKASV